MPSISTTPVAISAGQLLSNTGSAPIFYNNGSNVDIDRHIGHIAPGATLSVHENIYIAAFKGNSTYTVGVNLDPAGLDISAAINVQQLNCPAGQYTALCTLPIPKLTPHVTKILWTFSAHLNILTGTTRVTMSLDQSLNTNFTADGNFAFWNQDVTAGKQQLVAAQWVYDPRLNHVPPDVDLGVAGDRYMTLHVFPTGGAVTNRAASLSQIVGSMRMISIDETSANLLDGKGV